MSRRRLSGRRAMALRRLPQFRARRIVQSRCRAPRPERVRSRSDRPNSQHSVCVQASSSPPFGVPSDRRAAQAAMAQEVSERKRQNVVADMIRANARSGCPISSGLARFNMRTVPRKRAASVLFGSASSSRLASRKPPSKGMKAGRSSTAASWARVKRAPLSSCFSRSGAQGGLLASTGRRSRCVAQRAW